MNPDFFGDINLTDEELEEYKKLSDSYVDQEIQCNGEKVSYISFELTVEDFGVGMPAE